MTDLEQSLARLVEHGRNIAFGVLGPIELTERGRRHPLGGPKQRAVLALLISQAGSSVATDEIIESLYGEEASDRSHRSVHTFISNLRATLGDVIQRVGDGYALVADRMSIDAVRFERAVDESAAQDDAGMSSSLLRDALTLWRGQPYADVDLRGSLAAERTRLGELRVIAIGRRIDAELVRGKHATLIGELESLTRTYPLRESFRAQHMLALYRSGRQAEALRSFAKATEQLVRAAGLDPSPELQHLEQRILQHDPALHV